MGPRPGEPWWEAPEVVDVETLAERVLSGRPGRWRVCSSGLEDGDDVAAVCLALRGGCLLVDEADLWIDSSPEEHWIEQVERGRHYGVSMILATRRPYLIWRAATANAESAYQFRCWEERDYRWWQGYAGSEAAELVEGLEPFEAVSFDGRTGRIGRFRVPGPASAPAPEPVAREEEPLEADVDEGGYEEEEDEAEEVC